MADIQSILLPRRGKKSTMNGTKKETVLENGELFIEVPDAGIGKGHSKIKVGDGSTHYDKLPYALGDTENDEIAFTENTSENVTTALNSVSSGNKLGILIAGLKKAISLNNTAVTQLNDETIPNLKKSFQDGVDSIYELLKSLGFTPEGKDLDSIKKAIQKTYDDRYNSGVSAGKAQNNYKAHALYISHDDRNGYTYVYIDSNMVALMNEGRKYQMTIYLPN